MNREKSTGKEKKLHYELVIITLVIFSIILSACPPLEEDPYENFLVFDGPLDSSKWMDILNIIQTRGMPVNLDISACTVPIYGADVLKYVYEDGRDLEQDVDEQIYTQFNPLSGFPYGKEYIRSIILPKAATMISNATDIDIRVISEEDIRRSAFRHFTNLRSITGENIYLIGTLAFIDCKTLEEAKFDRAVHILQYSFSGCTNLKEVRFEVARDIMISSFEDCVNLERAILPYVGAVSERAFKNCQKLTEINFDVAAKIGDEAFRDCINLKYARFNANPMRTTISGTTYNGPPQIPPSSGNFLPDVAAALSGVIFYPNSLRGCKSLEVLDVRYAWNVYFARGVLADIGEQLELFLFDDDGTKSYGHPQTDMYLGDDTQIDECGSVTLRSITIRAPVVTPPGTSQIVPPVDEDTGIFHDIRGRYGSYFEDAKDPDTGEVTKYRVFVQRGPALLY